MSATEYEEFEASAVPGYAEEKVRAGTWTREESLARAREEFGELLPDGLASPDNHLFTARDVRSGRPVARVWFALIGEPGRREAYFYDIAVYAGLRGRGYGRATMTAGIEEARRAGASSVGLHVFGSNKAARSLYTSLGFSEVGVVMSLSLDASGDTARAGAHH
ncbi:GNAT family N-acetyltransferase [Streptomyces zhihengii]|uniref:GNAT family N-acetyltransferase n=1 Tax=Streptomyces zhihengii TaxID=1818004 RepID=UPI0033B7A1C9